MSSPTLLCVFLVHVKKRNVCLVIGMRRASPHHQRHQSALVIVVIKFFVLLFSSHLYACDLHFFFSHPSSSSTRPPPSAKKVTLNHFPLIIINKIILIKIICHWRVTTVSDGDGKMKAQQCAFLKVKTGASLSLSNKPVSGKILRDQINQRNGGKQGKLLHVQQ